MLTDFIFIVTELILCLSMYVCRRFDVNKKICMVLVFKVITIVMAFWGMNIEQLTEYQQISDSKKTKEYNKASILFLTMVYFKTFTLFVYLIFFLYFFLGTLIIIFTMIDFENQQQQVHNQMIQASRSNTTTFDIQLAKLSRKYNKKSDEEKVCSICLEDFSTNKQKKIS